MKKITFNCPACQFPLTVPESAAGATGPCPECQTVITGPDVDGGDAVIAEDAAVPAEPVVDPTPAPDSPPDSSIPSENQSEPPAATDLEADAESDSRPDALAEPAPRRVALGTVVTLCVVSSAICLAIGYQLGHPASSSPAGPPENRDPKLPVTSAPAVPEPKTPAPKTPDAGTPAVPTPTPTPPAPAPDGDPVAKPVPDAETKPAVPEVLTADRAALQAFLSAPDWASRQVHVLYPEQVLKQMEALAAKHGDGPIEVIRISPLHQAGEAAIFQVATKRHPKGFPIALSLTDGRWLVDWTGFAEFHYSLFKSFATGGPEQSGTFRLLIQPKLAEVGDVGRQPYGAILPDLGEATIIYAIDGSPVYQELEDTIGALAAKSPNSYRALMETGGIPLILHLSKASEGGQTILVVQEIVAKGWKPIPPETP